MIEHLENADIARKSINCQQIRKWWNIQKMLKKSKKYRKCQKRLENLENLENLEKKNLENERDSKWVSGQREIMVGQ